MSRIHDLNFFVKLGGAFALMLAAWLVPDWRYGIGLMTVTVLFLSRLKIPSFAGYLKGAMILVCMVIASWMLNLTLQGMEWRAALAVSVKMAARLVTTTASFWFVMETTTPGAILAACSAARLPSVATLVLSLTFGIIPMLRDEFARIGDAQRARGLEIDDVGTLTKIRYALARGVPLLVQAIRIAYAISFSLSIYGYDLKRRRSTWRRVGLMVEPRMTWPVPRSADVAATARTGEHE